MKSKTLSTDEKLQICKEYIITVCNTNDRSIDQDKLFNRWNEHMNGRIERNVMLAELTNNTEDFNYWKSYLKE